MTIEIKVPVLPESVSDATVSKWYKSPGDYIKRDENLVDLETDKVMLEVPAPRAGVIEKIVATEGSVVESNALLAVIREGDATSAAMPEVETFGDTQAKPAVTPAVGGNGASPSASKPAAAATKTPAAPATPTVTVTATPVSAAPVAPAKSGPAARRLMSEKGEAKAPPVSKAVVGKANVEKPAVVNFQKTEAPALDIPAGERTEKRVPMSRLRARIAERLVEVQHSAAILTTFNELNMQPVMDLRRRYKEQFEKAHGTRLGFMSFFTKAVIEALKRFPSVNASIDGNDIIYHDYFDIGIAIGSDRGLVVPILRNADTMSMADIEKNIREYAEKAKSAKLTMEEMTGGTFTITNGGTYGSMMSTPIINAPQSGILGMHNIIERPVVEKGEIVIRPMMYVAMSYDHRIIDGSESVRFLVTIKEMIENPARLLLEV